MAHESSGLTQLQMAKRRGIKSSCGGERYPATAYACRWRQEIVEAGQRVVGVAGMETGSEPCNRDDHEISSDRGDHPREGEGDSMLAEITADEHDDAPWRRLEAEASEERICGCGALDYGVCACADNPIDGDCSRDHSTVTKKIIRLIKSVG